MTAIFWFRRDVRLDDNPGLAAAGEDGTVIPLFVVDPSIYEAVSARRRDLLMAGLRDLDAELRRRDARLRVEYGDPAEVVPRVASEAAARVHVSLEITPKGRARDEAVGSQVELVEHDGIYTHPQGSVMTAEGNGYQVFTPFYRAWSGLPVEPHDLPDGISFTNNPGAGPQETGAGSFDAGPSGAWARLERFQEVVDTYHTERDRIDHDRTSHLSVDLKYGWIGPRRVIDEIGTSGEGREAFVRQMAWRDFYGDLLAREPDFGSRTHNPAYRGVRWRSDQEEIAAWKQGQTGFPIVDAAMRQLVAEGWIHNRARMIVASFLVKDLLVDWRVGEGFFRHHLTDGDVAQNAGNWQWVAGTGTDAAPYFRVFNPVTQSKKFDPTGEYIRRWVPELAEVPDEWIHVPWRAGPLELLGYGVELGREYPAPIVDHAMARQRAIDAYEAARGSR